MNIYMIIYIYYTIYNIYYIYYIYCINIYIICSQLGAGVKILFIAVQGHFAACFVQISESTAFSDPVSPAWWFHSISAYPSQNRRGSGCLLMFIVAHHGPYWDGLTCNINTKGTLEKSNPRALCLVYEAARLEIVSAETAGTYSLHGAFG